MIGGANILGVVFLGGILPGSIIVALTSNARRIIGDIKFNFVKPSNFDNSYGFNTRTNPLGSIKIK